MGPDLAGAATSVAAGIGIDDWGLVVLFVVLALLRLLKTVSDKMRRGPGHERVPEEDAPPTPHPEHGRPRAPRPAPGAAPPLAPTATPPTPRLGDRTSTALSSEVPPGSRPHEAETAWRVRTGGRALLLGKSLPPHDRVRSALLWGEVLRRPRALRFPRKKSPS